MHELMPKSLVKKRGHDLFLFLWPRPDLEQHVIDLKEVYDECIKTSQGKPFDLATRGILYNLKNKEVLWNV